MRGEKLGEKQTVLSGGNLLKGYKTADSRHLSMKQIHGLIKIEKRERGWFACGL